MDVEPETLSLALRLQSEYLEEIRDKKGKSQEGEISDLQLAVQFYKNELATQEQFLSDLALSRSIARAVEADAEVIRRLVSEEEQAAHDRHVAMVLDSPGQCHAEPPAQDVTNAPSTPDSATLERLAALNNYDAVDYDALMTDRLPDEPESSAGAGERAAQPDSASHDSETFGICDSCNDSFRTDSLAHCSCSHNYCCECLNGLFQASLTDEGLFPPRCCRQEIPVDPNFLPPRLIGQFRAKQLEYNCQDRTYCHEPSCSTFVPGQFIRDGVAICVKCYRRTCVRCKGPMHDRDCPQDPEVQEMLRVARENGWQRCYSCGRMVELTYGCNHMSTYPSSAGSSFCSSPRSNANTLQPVPAVPSSATRAGRSGKPANAQRGTRRV